jgi:hypothetical protein
VLVWVLSDCGNSCRSEGDLLVLEEVTSCGEVGPGESLTTSDSLCKLALSVTVALLSVTAALSRFVSAADPELCAVWSGE